MKSFAREADRAEIVVRLRRVRPESARRWGSMTAHQMICHLSDTCRMALGEKHVREIGTPLGRAFWKYLALYVPIAWPPGIETRPEIDQRSGGTVPADFASDLAELESLLARIAARSASGTCPRHPIFGRMSCGDWLRWAYLHTDHHLRQFGV